MKRVAIFCFIFWCFIGFSQELSLFEMKNLTTMKPNEAKDFLSSKYWVLTETNEDEEHLVTSTYDYMVDDKPASYRFVVEVMSLHNKIVGATYGTSDLEIVEKIRKQTLEQDFTKLSDQENEDFFTEVYKHQSNDLIFTINKVKDNSKNFGQDFWSMVIITKDAVLAP